ncbi:MAG: hypothetical protein KDB23_29415, partial [Planctomycetales bacterium]|nr:hypothetical protein [Planctomycetales bacterium]
MSVTSSESVEIVSRLRAQLLAAAGTCGDEQVGAKPVRPVTLSGWDELDRMLPLGGFPAGSLTEWFVDSEGSGGATLALRLAAQVCAEGQDVEG